MLEERKEPHTVDSYIQKSETCADGRRPTLIEIEHAWILEYKSILMMMMMMMAASENNQIFFPTRLLLLLLFHIPLSNWKKGTEPSTTFHVSLIIFLFWNKVQDTLDCEMGALDSIYGQPTSS